MKHAVDVNCEFEYPKWSMLNEHFGNVWILIDQVTEHNQKDFSRMFHLK